MAAVSPSEVANSLTAGGPPDAGKAVEVLAVLAHVRLDIRPRRQGAATLSIRPQWLATPHQPLLALGIAAQLDAA